MNEVITGDATEELERLDENSVHMVMTSPPYWNLRDYDHDDQLGLEGTSEEFVQNLADVFDKVKRVLREDGSLWLNLGDTYEDKDLQLIPNRVALELKKRGWILRNDVTWYKSNPIPTSIKDRLTNSTEHIYHFVLEKEYYYDIDEIREPHNQEVQKQLDKATDKEIEEVKSNYMHYAENNLDSRERSKSYNNNLKCNPKGKKPPDVFEVTTKPFPEAHFAVYPPELCEKPIKATCPKDGVVLDPFVGAGTTLLKAKELGRNYIGIELNPEYADMARSRIGLDVNDPSRLRDESETGLEAFE